MRVFPFTAIVGQERMKRALVLNAISPQIGGVLIRGERGTAKSTAARALAALLPEIEVVADCPFNCNPNDPEQMCDTCRERFRTQQSLPVEQTRTRFVDLPVSATEDRVVGTLDMERAIKHGERRFEPGVLATANRGLLYVDEVNLLDDHVVDLLLDSAAMGINVVEREGISFSHPARFILVGTMNPEEGELRPQLLDRFALCVDIQGILDPDARVEIVNRRLRYEEDPEAFYQQWSEMEAMLSERIARAREMLPEVTYEPEDLYFIAELTSEMEVDGHRADIVILKAALAHAAFGGRETIDNTDILLAAELALPHRLRRQPFEDTDSKMAVLEQRLEEARDDGEGPSERQRVERSVLEGKKKKTESLSADAQADSQAPAENVPMRGHHADTRALDHLRQEGQSVDVGDIFKPQGFKTPLDKTSRRSAGRRSYTITTRKRGRYIYARPARERYDDIALDATVRQAAIHQSEREHGDTAITIRGKDLQRKVRVRKASNLIVFVVDASWSMAAAERMKATKGAIMSLLVDAYQKRDRVCMISFQKDSATLILPPTSSVEMAKAALRDIPVGGKTPLSAGLSMAYQMIKREESQNDDLRTLMFLLTDGAGNVSMMGMPPREEALLVADLFAQRRIHSVVINTEHQSLDRGLAQELADALKAPCESLTNMRAENLYHTVRRALQK